MYLPHWRILSRFVLQIIKKKNYKQCSRVFRLFRARKKNGKLLERSRVMKGRKTKKKKVRSEKFYNRGVIFFLFFFLLQREKFTNSMSTKMYVHSFMYVRYFMYCIKVISFNRLSWPQVSLFLLCVLF